VEGKIVKLLNLFQNPVGANLRFDVASSWKNRSEPDFSTKFIEAVPKTEVFGQPLSERKGAGEAAVPADSFPPDCVRTFPPMIA
jgi:hypothetical protein